MHCVVIKMSKILISLVAGTLLFATTSAIAQEGGYFSGVRFGASEKAWSFTAPGLKLGQALEFRLICRPCSQPWLGSITIP